MRSIFFGRLFKIWTVVAVLVLSVSVLGICAYAQTTDENGEIISEPVVVYSGKAGANLTYALDDAGTLVIDGTGEMYNYSIPQTLGVSTAPWMSFDIPVKKVIIGENVTYIGKYAFYGSTTITSISFPSGFKSLGQYSLARCSALEEIHITSVYSWIDIVEHGNGNLTTEHKKYVNGELLTELVIPENVTTIPQNAFNFTQGIERVVIGEHVTVVKDNAFNTCRDIKSAYIGSGVTEIVYGMFGNCDSLSDISGMENVTKIGGHAFYKNVSLESFSISSKVTSIDMYAFNSCTSLESVSFDVGESLVIKNYVFQNCTRIVDVIVDDLSDWMRITFENQMSNPVYNSKKLTVNGNSEEFVIPDGTTHIPANAFVNCASLKHITIPSSVSSVGETAFYGTMLRSVTIQDLAAWCNIDFSSGSTPFYQYSQRITRLYLGDEELTDIVIGAEATKIGSYAFAGCASIQSVKITGGVESIGNYAFYRCDNLHTVELNSTVNTIGKYAFSNDTSLKNVSIPFGVVTINDNAFASTSIENVTFPVTLKKIGANAFNSTRIVSVELHYGFESLGSNAFAGCKYLVSVILPDTLTAIPSSAFVNCPKLASVVLPKYLESIGDSAFYICSALTSIELPETLRTIGRMAFANCGITEIVIPDRITVIEDSVFNGCSKLREVTFSKNLTSIGAESFAYTRLEKVVIPRSVTTIKSNAFKSIYTNSVIILPDTDITFGSSVFYNPSPTQVSVVVYVPEGSAAHEYALGEKYITYKLITADIDGDGAATNADIALAVRYLSGWDISENVDGGFDHNTFDLNSDGRITNRDAMLAVFKLAYVPEEE